MEARLRELLDNAAAASDELAMAMSDLSRLLVRDIPRLYSDLQNAVAGLEYELERMHQLNNPEPSDDPNVMRET